MPNLVSFSGVHSESRSHAEAGACCTIVGNKSDLRHLRTVTRTEAEDFAKVKVVLQTQCKF